MKILKLTTEETNAIKDCLNFGLEENEFSHLEPEEEENKELIKGVVRRLEEKKQYKQKEYSYYSSYYTVVSIEELETLLQKAKEENKYIYKNTDEPVPKFATLVLNFRETQFNKQLRLLGV